MYTMPKNLLSICVNFTLATQRVFARIININSCYNWNSRFLQTIGKPAYAAK